MKNVKRMLVVALCGVMMSGSVWAVAPRDCKNNKCGSFQVGMYHVKNTLSMRLMMEKNRGEKVLVRLLNNKGQVLHEEMVGKRTNKYARKFDFSQIQDGSYTLEITNGEERVQKDINLSTAGVVEMPKRTLVAIN
ncbi:MAG: hypothetical protein KKG00_11370 [Bacteroidetes bacterium]|nr:hypothetical protein [Bacteroidota bacterium]